MINNSTIRKSNFDACRIRQFVQVMRLIAFLAAFLLSDVELALTLDPSAYEK